MKLTKYNQLTHNMKVTCTIGGIKIDDAKLSIDRRTGKVFICQDYKDGAETKNKLGYKYSWFLTHRGENVDRWDACVKNLESVEKVNTGFDPENLTFDGVEIKEGDEVEVNKTNWKGTVSCFKNRLSLVVRTAMTKNKTMDNVFMPIDCLNITAHHPKKDKELERLEAEYSKSAYRLYSDSLLDEDYYSETLDRYYQARKKLEEYKNNNQ
jgi:hypothetical protein